MPGGMPPDLGFLESAGLIATVNGLRYLLVDDARIASSCACATTATRPR